MILQRGFENPAAYRGGFLSIGNFDGVHRGHQQIVAALVGHARKAGLPAVALTFEPHPITILRPGEVPPSLSTLEHKAELLAKLGVDCLIAYPTDVALLNKSPEAFFQDIVRTEIQAAGLVEGDNFFFGHNRAGDIETLTHLCRAARLLIEVVPPVKLGERIVSSSTVRARIAEGLMGEAVELLGHPYRATGRVVKGAGRGGPLGFPTANLEDVKTLLPPDGVYAASVPYAGRTYPAAVHLGPNPTFGESVRKFEAHLIGFSGSLYDTWLDVDFLERVRETQRFDGALALQRQLQQDIATAQAIVARVGTR